MLSLTVLLLVAVSGVLSASQVPKCTPESIEKVKAQWDKTGVPQDVTKSEDTFKVIAGSPSQIPQQAVGKSFKFTPGYLHDLSGNVKTTLTEENGVLTLPDSKAYLISFDKGILWTLRCSDDGPEPSEDNPLIVSLATTDNVSSVETEKKLAEVQELGYNIAFYP